MRVIIILHCYVLVLLLVVILPFKGRGNHTGRVKIVSPHEIQGKIMGGVPVPIEKFPSAAMLFNTGAMCSGTVLNSWTVLTAAHCFDHNEDVTFMDILVGAQYRLDYNAESYYVASVTRHEQYNRAMIFACDIALVFVAKPFVFHKKVQKAILPVSDAWMDEQEYQFAVTGWGLLSYDGEFSQVGLLMTNMRYMSRDRCGQLNQLDLTPDMFCLYGDGTRDSCRGDSGGGVMWNGMVVGVVSFGDGCGKPNKPSMYSNVFHFRNWIKNNIQKYFDHNCTQKNKEERRNN